MIQYSDRLHAQEADGKRRFKTFSKEIERTETRKQMRKKSILF
jgi:hypothetical protein